MLLPLGGHLPVKAKVLAFTVKFALSRNLKRHPEILYLCEQVKFEPAAPVGEKSSAGAEFSEGAPDAAAPLFPHLYGTIDYSSVVRELPVLRSPEGEFLDISFAA